MRLAGCGSNFVRNGRAKAEKRTGPDAETGGRPVCRSTLFRETCSERHSTARLVHIFRRQVHRRLCTRRAALRRNWKSPDFRPKSLKSGLNIDGIRNGIRVKGAPGCSVPGIDVPSGRSGYREPGLTIRFPAPGRTQGFHVRRRKTACLA
jgi:hypothetical protein